MKKAFEVARGTVSVLAFIVSLAQIIEYGYELTKKVRKPKKVKGFVAPASNQWKEVAEMNDIVDLGIALAEGVTFPSERNKKTEKHLG